MVGDLRLRETVLFAQTTKLSLKVIHMTQDHTLSIRVRSV